MLTTTLQTLPTLLLAAAGAPDAAHAGAHDAAHAAASAAGPWWAVFVLILPVVAALACGLFAIVGNRSRLPAFATAGCLGGAFVTTVLLAFATGIGPGAADAASATSVVHLFEWIGVSWGDGPGQTLTADFGLYLDGLTMLWMLFVTGLATAICLYASEYMNHDVGPNYARFFGAFALFVVSMTCLVMGDNLLLLYLGWEGVGLCSYLLIGYFFKKDAAVQAAKKAFVVNRIGDLGLALGVYLTFVHFGTLEYSELFASEKLQGYLAAAAAGDFSLTSIPMEAQVIPILLMIGAFGKSAQFPLYVWLPDAMEGPTPVSALIHAATMVTAGVFLIARTFPLFLCSSLALPIVAWVGTITALLAATIAMAQFDIKRIMAYSTVSQLGYMFAGLGVLTPTGGVYHVLTHAFFKATLFLACGAVMHGFAGQLSPRKLSGLAHLPGWRVTSFAMLVGCLNLAGVPFTAGYFSKDTILAEAFVTGAPVIGTILLVTAGITAYYTFRVFFRVFVGPVSYEPGDDHHDAHEPDAHGHTPAHGHGHEHGHAHGHGAGGGFHPHAPGWAINTVLAGLAIVSLAASGLYFVGSRDVGHHGHEVHTKHWTETMVMTSSGAYHSPYAEALHAATKPGKADTGADASGESAKTPLASIAPVPGPRGERPPGLILGLDPHKAMYYVSGVVGLIGILLAAALHGPRGIQGLFLGGRTEAGRCRMDAIAARCGPVPRWAERKWYVDELYTFLFINPLRALGQVFAAIDSFFVDGLVRLAGSSPRWLARGLRPLQSGEMHGYAAAMAGGVGLVLVVIMIAAAAAGGGS